MQIWSDRYRQIGRQRGRQTFAAALSISFVFLGIIPVRLAIAAYQSPMPEAILVLGGSQSREYAAAKLARNYPQMKVWISSGSMPEDALKMFEFVGASTEQLQLDYSATDTVTNFTTILPQLQRQNIKHVYLVTSDYHMNRAKAIAAIVFGSHGITFTPVPVPSHLPEESYHRIVRDVGRTLFWMLTGQSGAELKSSRCRAKNKVDAITELLIDGDIQCPISRR